MFLYVGLGGAEYTTDKVRKSDKNTEEDFSMWETDAARRKERAPQQNKEAKSSKACTIL